MARGWCTGVDIADTLDGDDIIDAPDTDIARAYMGISAGPDCIRP